MRLVDFDNSHCSGVRLLPQQSTVTVFFYCGYPRFWNVNSPIPVDDFSLTIHVYQKGSQSVNLSVSDYIMASFMRVLLFG